MQPNIVLVVIDDLGWRDLACYGSSLYETPHLDRLAREGLRFTDAYASCPVCSPTRASIMTGKYPATIGITNFIYGQAEGKLQFVPFLPHLPREEMNVAHALREGGYATWHVGKWHLGGGEYEPQHQGFEVNIGGGSPGMPGHGYWDPYRLPNLPDRSPGEYLTDRLTDEAIALIRTHDRQRPFFLNLWHYAVHIPIQAPPELVRKYEAKAKALGLDQVPAIQEGEEFSCLHKRGYRIRRRLIQSDPAYAAMMENLDANIGRLLAALDQAGQRDNTLVIFTSDNGGLATAEGCPTTNRPLLEGKGWVYEGGTRVCLLARWPGHTPVGGVCQVPVTSTDLFPTFLECAGLPLRPEAHVDGVSLRALLEGTHRLEREAIFWHYPHYSNQGGTPACSIRAGDWKLIEFFEDGHLELYNLREDLSEERNRCSDLPELASRLHTRLVAWRTSIEAKVPPPNPNWEHQRTLPPEPMDAAYT